MNGLMHCSKIASLFDHLVSAEQCHHTSGLTAVAVLRLIMSPELVGAFAFAGQLRLIDRAA
jgi:hypothetical protein